MSEIAIHLFGPTRVTVGPEAAPLRLGRSALGLLVFLAVHPERPMQRDYVSAELWPDSAPDKARSRLSTAIWRLRKALRLARADDVIEDGPGGTLGLSPRCAGAVDINRFARAARAFLEDPDGAACPCTAAGVGALDPLAGWDELWALSARVRLEDLREACLVALLQRHCAEGDDVAAKETAEALLTIDPLREDIYQTLMRVAARQGRQGLVGRTYERCRQALADDLGIPPSAETDDLLAALRSQPGDTLPPRDPERAALADLRRALAETQRNLARISTCLDSILCR